MSLSALRILGMQHAILTLILVGLMLASIPLGAYVVFVESSGADFKLDSIKVPIAGFQLELPIDFSAGYMFTAFWSVYIVMIGIALLGPRLRIKSAIQSITTARSNSSWIYNNHMIAAVSWFTIFVLVSTIIDVTQTNFGVQIISPDYDDDFFRLYDATRAPIIEELGFRVLLIGVPLAGVYMFRSTLGLGLRSLLCPYSVHGTRSLRVALGLIVASAIFFGVLHIVGDGSWSAGKITQAGAAGVILGWVYYRHGLLVAILVHWAANYFVLSVLYFVASTTNTTLSAASGHPASAALEILLIASGIISAAFLFVGRARTKLDA